MFNGTPCALGGLVSPQISGFPQGRLHLFFAAFEPTCKQCVLLLFVEASSPQKLNLSPFLVG